MTKNKLLVSKMMVLQQRNRKANKNINYTQNRFMTINPSMRDIIKLIKFNQAKKTGKARWRKVRKWKNWMTRKLHDKIYISIIKLMK